MPSDELSSKEVSFGRLTLREEDEYVDFLMNAYRDQFNFAAFKDREMVKRFWRWEYADNPNAAKGEPLIWLCRFKNRIVAQACLMPVELKTDGKYFKAGWCQNVMILPEFRNMGLGYFLFKHLLGGLKEGEIDILLAAGTNNNSYTLLKYLGFTDLGFIDRNIKSLLFGFRGSSSVTGEMQISEETDFGSDFDNFWKAVSQKYSHIVKRDAGNLRWRFVKNPYSRYKVLCARAGNAIKGYAVVKEGCLKGRLKGVRVGIISDILFDPKDKATGIGLFASAFSYFRKSSGLVRCDILSGEMEGILRSAGFFNIKSNNRFLVHRFSEEAKRSKDDVFENSASWHITYGDSDLDIF